MVSILAVDHIGIRVADEKASVAFYEKLGFELVFRGGTEPVVILRNGHGVEINLILNGKVQGEPKNVLMDVPEKHPGYTHVALGVESIEETVAELERLGIPLSGGPVKLGDRFSMFIRDPDRNVVELRARHESSAQVGAERGWGPAKP